MISRDVWSYGEDRVLVTIGRAPVEEYLFFLLQPLLTGLWLYRILQREELALTREKRPIVRFAGTLVWLAASLGGIPLLLWWSPGYYLGAILVWAGPVLAAQWAYGGEDIWRARRSWALGVAAPTVYLWIVDRLALSSGIWSVSEEYTTGFVLLGLPLEEAVFFAVTNLMVVQGLLLFLFLSERARARSGEGRARPGGHRGRGKGVGPGLSTPPRP